MNGARQDVTALGGMRRDGSGSRITPDTSSSDPTYIDDTAIVCAHGDFESAATAPGPIDEEPAAAIDAPDVPKATIAQDSLATPAGDRPAIVQAGADRQVDRDCLRWRRQRQRHDKSENETEASEQGTTHDILHDAFCVTSSRQEDDCQGNAGACFKVGTDCPRFGFCAHDSSASRAKLNANGIF